MPAAAASCSVLFRDVVFERRVASTAHCDVHTEKMMTVGTIAVGDSDGVFELIGGFAHLVGESVGARLGI